MGSLFVLRLAGYRLVRCSSDAITPPVVQAISRISPG